MIRRTRSVSFMAPTLVLRWVIRHPREQGELSALAREHVAPERRGVVREELLGQGRLDDPRVDLHLSLELSRSPTRVAGVAPPPPHGRGEVLQIDVRGGEPDVRDDYPG